MSNKNKSGNLNPNHQNKNSNPASQSHEQARQSYSKERQTQMTLQPLSKQKRKIVQNGAEVIARIVNLKETFSTSLSQHVALLKAMLHMLQSTSFGAVPDIAKIELVLHTLNSSTLSLIQLPQCVTFDSFMIDLEQLAADQEEENDQDVSTSKRSLAFDGPPPFSDSETPHTSSSSSSSSSTNIECPVKDVKQHTSTLVPTSIILSDSRCPKGWKRLVDGSGYLNVLTNETRRQIPALSAGGVSFEEGVPSVRDLSHFIETFSTNVFNEWIQANENSFFSLRSSVSSMNDTTESQQDEEFFSLLCDQLKGIFQLSVQYNPYYQKTVRDKRKIASIEEWFRGHRDGIIEWISKNIIPNLPSASSKAFIKEAAKDQHFRECFMTFCLAVFKVDIMATVATTKCKFVLETVGEKIPFDRECHSNLFPMNSGDPLYCSVLFPGLVTVSNSEMVHQALVAK